MAGKYTYEQLCKMSNDQLDVVFKQGTIPNFERLNGFEFKGYNTPKFAKLMGIQKFKKGFFKKNDQPFGYNVPVQQNSLYARWICCPSDQEPKRFGFYSVKEAVMSTVENKERNALVLNYGDGDNALTEGSFIRDYLVQVEPDNPDLYLGKAYLALGSIRKFSNYFILERDRQTWMR